MNRLRVLATDMDGTFIPLDDNEENRSDLDRLIEFLRQTEIELVYVTGRHYESVLDAIESERLPNPAWMICDVGTSIYHRSAGGEHQSLPAYAEHLSQRVMGCEAIQLRETVSTIPGLRLQEPEKQGRFKLSYYCDAGDLSSRTDAILAVTGQRGLAYHVVSSVDPFNGDGLIDVMPMGVNKAYALRWWSTHRGYTRDAVMFAGDSGNDLAALTEGYHSIVVGNSPEFLKAAVREAHVKAGWADRLFHAQRVATSGVLDGAQHFTKINGSS